MLYEVITERMEAIAALVASPLDTSNPVFLMEERLLRLDKSSFLAEVYAAPIWFGGVQAVQVVVRDLGPRKQAEEALRESEQRFRSLFDAMGDGVVIYDPIGEGGGFLIRDINRAGERIAQVNHLDVIGRNVEDAFPGVRAFVITSYSIHYTKLYDPWTPYFPLGPKK